METTLSDHITGFDRNVVMVVAAGMVGLVACLNFLVRGFRSPLKHVPGPWHTRFSRLRLKAARLTGRRLHYVHSLHEKYGSIVRVAPNEISCVDLQSVARVYKIGGGFDKAQWVGDYTKRLPALSLSMIVDSDEAKERRRLIQGSFTLSSLRENWEAEIRQKIELAVAKIRSEALAGSSNTHKWWTFMAADIISKMSFGESLGLMDLGKSTMYMRAIENALPADVFQCELPFLDHLSKLVPKSLLQTFTRRLEQVRAGGRDGVETLRRQRDKTRSLFKEMVAECDKDGRPWLTDDAVTMEGAGMMVAGTDTTAAVLTYLIWSVLQQEGLQKRLEEEVAQLGDDFDDRRLETCSLLRAVVEETLRMYPAVPSSLPRIVPDEGVTLGSYFIPGKTVVYSPAYTLQRNPDIFAKPHKFDADRYLYPGKVSLEQRQAFIPLGAGARVCIGQHLAMMELRLATAVFFKRCRGARLSDSMPQDSMDMADYVLLSPKRKRCDVVLN
ncbi:Cytochrome P450 3A17 [Colletotrichum higginsianum IMI 349063]|uniref:Cytochrome P450 3A17 n=2 Tax=Colletotrichum higginsianum (strain IMI 349063) TaxID=759273 RepID=A0A1B7YEP5_COLHI|nr:Cytochrome P450 3A17 [Colletotrichum higginsianum IMI 349063]OBR10577.1 Cytochrome P450 3A17 [Colletotrichum higginsianum IMI 349063]